ncbi:MAG: electron transfer flavoprotein subunit alpha/FixB family protein [Actinomycetaceae bacterium]|nr:electron transfer flavoprotein subunit alpha/FixB family protein [Actinomycetaceae bacterium]
MEKISAPILVITDHKGNAEDGFILTEPSKQLLTLARQLTTGRIDTVALNPAPQIEELAKYGAARVFVPVLGDLSAHVAAVAADAAFEVARQDPSYAAVLNVSNYRGREVAAVLAVRLGSGAVVDVTECGVVDGQITAHKSVLAGSWKTAFKVTRGTPVIGLRPSSVEASEVEAPAEPEVISVDVEYSAPARGVQVLESLEESAAEGIPLTEAPVVVCGGRGTDGDFSMVEELANRLGGAVGATRVAADEGWIDRSAQIGQTGVTVAPTLYLGVGVSGAIHHVCGIQASQHIVAVCDDPDAPIFEIADFGVVGDVNEVLPQALEVLKEKGF